MYILREKYQQLILRALGSVPIVALTGVSFSAKERTVAAWEVERLGSGPPFLKISPKINKGRQDT